ncbi:hypothetical protein MHH28_30590 [Paenibacillus sp. FSL K6-1217]|uniref:hypothetical protein n=1 Tax=Paenibacillus sp. FSL K6-1217 TaxID=2921466 RepID=UPI00324F42AB
MRRVWRVGASDEGQQRIRQGGSSLPVHRGADSCGEYGGLEPVMRGSNVSGRAAVACQYNAARIHAASIADSRLMRAAATRFMGGLLPSPL